VVDAMIEADLFRLFVPREFGGAELSPLDFLEVIEAAAAIDGSVGWVMTNGAGLSRTSGYVAEDVARAWFGHPAAFAACSAARMGHAVPVAGGYRVTGRWPFASGIHHATLLMGACIVTHPDGTVPDDPPPVLRACFFTPSEARVIDTWHVSGLRGTGSCDFEVTDLFVPEAHTHDLFAHVPTRSGTIYRLPNITAFPMTIAPVPLGIARAAIGHFVELAGAHARQGMPTLRDREIVQDMVGRCEARLGAARAFLREALQEVIDSVDADAEGLTRARARFRTACAHGAETAQAIMDTLEAQAGSIAIAESNPLERCSRDLRAAVKHIAVSPAYYAIAGRLRLGVAPGGPRF
jgi:alkylation response protein AidB-like acyl-CoA dehydrogenase